MSHYDISFRNSRDLVKRGTGICQGLLYCEKRYTSYGGCACLNCDGICGPTNKCPCPDCDYTLTCILYSSGQMNCPKCKKKLLRLNLLNRVNLFGKNANYAVICDLCKRRYTEKFIPLLCCKNCDFDMCPNCAISKVNFTKLKDLQKDNYYWGSGKGEGIIYCGKEYTLPGKCKCGCCDGKCGLADGCPCPICDLRLGYNIYINNNMICGRCKNALLIKTTLIELQKINNKYESGFSCNNCHLYYKDIFGHIYHCFKCDNNICQKCAYNTIKNKELVFPYLPSVQFVNPNEPKGGNNGTKTDENNMKCCVCFDKVKLILFRPCNHIICCKKCSERLDTCPKCRAIIQSKEDVYY